MATLFLLITAFMAGLVQGVSGFGSGIILMLFLPFQFPLLESSAIVGIVAYPLSISLLFVYRKYVNFKRIIVPTIVYSIVTVLSIEYFQQIDQDNLGILFNAFLIILSLSSFNKKKLKINRITAFIMYAVSGFTGAIFGIGGPLMAIYFLETASNKEEYLGTMQAFLVLSSVMATWSRITNNLLTVNHINPILIGIAGILAGVFIANKVVDSVNERTIKRLVYILIGVTGLLNLTSIIF